MILRGTLLLLFSVTIIIGGTLHISSSKEPAVYLEGEEILLNCSANSTGVIILDWIVYYSISDFTEKKDSHLSEGINKYWSVLKYKATARDNARRLTCSASNSTWSTKRYIDITVALLPSDPIISGPSNINSLVVFTWTCRSQGASYFPPSIRWRSGNGIPLKGRINHKTEMNIEEHSNNVYTIASDITMSLPALYPVFYLYCVMDYYPKRTIEVSRVIRVSTLIEKVFIQSESEIYQAGRHVQLECSIVSSSFKYLKWIFPYKLVQYDLSTGADLVNSTGNQVYYWSKLTYLATEFDNSRSLTCKGFNSTWSEIQHVYVTIVLPPDTPVITGPDKVMASATYTWTCVTSGASFIPPSVNWQIGDGEELTEGVTKSTSIFMKPHVNMVHNITSTVTMTPYPSSDKFVLRCIAKHQLSDYISIKTASKIITVEHL